MKRSVAKTRVAPSGDQAGWRSAYASQNAIDHGIAPRAGHGRLEIWARRRGNQLWLEVRDNGVGLRGATRAGDLVPASGIGVSNTRSRLQCLYGAAYQFEFCRVGPGGLTVRLVIPWREASPAAPAPAVGELAS